MARWRGSAADARTRFARRCLRARKPSCPRTPGCSTRCSPRFSSRRSPTRGARFPGYARRARGWSWSATGTSRSTMCWRESGWRGSSTVSSRRPRPGRGSPTPRSSSKRSSWPESGPARRCTSATRWRRTSWGRGALASRRCCCCAAAARDPRGCGRSPPSASWCDRAVPSVYRSASMDEGLPIAYQVLEDGVPVYASDGEQLGSVDHVVAAPEEDIFHGVVIRTAHGQRFVAADQVASLHERGVDLSIEAAQAADLPDPGGTAPAWRVHEPGGKPRRSSHLRETGTRAPPPPQELGLEEYGALTGGFGTGYIST